MTCSCAVCELCSLVNMKTQLTIAYICTHQVAYTFDAGPNACLYLMEDMVPMMLGLVQTYFPPEQDHGEAFLTGLPSKIPAPSQVGVFHTSTVFISIHLAHQESSLLMFISVMRESSCELSKGI